MRVHFAAIEVFHQDAREQAGSIAEQVIYVAAGQYVRFPDRAILIETLRHRGDRK